MPLEADIIGLLDNAQSSLHHHQKLLKAFRALHDRHDPITFFEAFFAPFTNVLLVYKREPAVERVVDFVTKFAASVASKGTCVPLFPDLLPSFVVSSAKSNRGWDGGAWDEASTQCMYRHIP